VGGGGGADGAVFSGRGRRLRLGKTGCLVQRRMAALFMREREKSGCPPETTEDHETMRIDISSCHEFDIARANTNTVEFHSTA
jgi:hypothetical protein